ncbi:hypothetical protein [Jeotgalibacillus proteolyticus]
MKETEQVKLKLAFKAILEKSSVTWRNSTGDNGGGKMKTPYLK